jgi:hypothetical protein
MRAGRTRQVPRSNGGQEFGLLENRTAPGGVPPPHIHTHEGEFFNVPHGSSRSGSRKVVRCPAYGLETVEFG